MFHCEGDVPLVETGLKSSSSSSSLSSLSSERRGQKNHARAVGKRAPVKKYAALATSNVDSKAADVFSIVQ